MELLCIVKGYSAIVLIHLISPNQGGVTEVLTVFIVMLFLPVHKARGIGGRGAYYTAKE